MSRNDGSLYSGINASQATTHTVREVAREVKEERRNKLTASEEILLEMIARNRKNVTDQLASLPMTFETEEKDVKSVLLAYQMNLQFIDSFSAQISNIMRKK